MTTVNFFLLTIGYSFWAEECFWGKRLGGYGILYLVALMDPHADRKEHPFPFLLNKKCPFFLPHDFFESICIDVSHKHVQCKWTVHLEKCFETIIFMHL
jgi:hypothetical protein